MKKFYTPLLLCSIPALLFGQHPTIPEAAAVPIHESNMEVSKVAAAQSAPNNIASYGDTIWSEDFSNGIPSSWTLVDKLSKNYVWTYETNTNLTCTWTNVDIATSSVNNGYALVFADKYNSDAACQNNVAQDVLDTYMQTDAIDCSSLNSVILQFQQAFRYCCYYATSQISVFVSNDSINWTEWKVKKGLSFNIASPNPDYVNLNISSVAAGQSKVYLRFHMYGISFYYWAVDDIAVVEGPTNDMVVEEDYSDFNYLYGGFYAKMPMKQANSANIGWRAATVNNGSAAQTGVALNVDVTKTGSGSVFTDSGTPMSINAGSRDTLSTPNSFSPGSLTNSLGQYTFNFNISQTESDEEPSNNTVTADFEVTDTVFARDNGTDDGGVGPHSYTCCTADGSEIATEYDFTADEEISSISFFVRPGSDSTGISVICNLYAPFATTPLAQTDLYDIKPGDRGNWVTLPFLVPFTGLADSTYFASIAVFGLDNGKVLWVGDEREVHQPSTDFDPNTWVYGGAWYWVPATPMIRLNTRSNVGVNDMENESAFGIYPNPSSGLVHIYTKTQSPIGTTKVEVLNLVGQTVYSGSANFSNQTTHMLDLSEYPHGVYVVRIQGENTIYSHRVVIE